MTNYKSADSSGFAFFFLKTYTMKRLMLFAAGIFFLLNTNAQKNRLKKSGWQNVIVR